ncbi:hypothetical protein PM082_018713 [Marasmius tenuissimus]|nr:hypothetical protein PM082_018713 [Marasmius tenuissimus]
MHALEKCAHHATDQHEARRLLFTTLYKLGFILLSAGKKLATYNGFVRVREGGQGVLDVSSLRVLCSARTLIL